MMMNPNQKSPKPRPDVTEPDIRDDPDDLPDYGDPPVEEPPQSPFPPERGAEVLKTSRSWVIPAA